MDKRSDCHFWLRVYNANPSFDNPLRDTHTHTTINKQKLIHGQESKCVLAPQKNNVPMQSSRIGKKFNLSVSVARGSNWKSELTAGRSRIRQEESRGRRSCSAECRHSWRNTCFNKFICHVTMRNGMQNFWGRATPMLLTWIWIWFRGGC